MEFKFLLLFLTAMIAGSLVFFAPNFREKYFKLVLVFAGSYLFSITVLHLLPELFSSGFDGAKMGLFILIGFLLQQLLEFLSSGIEHGHIHHHHGETKSGVITVMLGLFIHAFLEGTLLSHDNLISAESVAHTHGGQSVLIGIVMHKGPAAFALAAVLSSSLSKKWTLILLTIFALASPLGMFSSSFLFESGILQKEGIGMLYGLVVGGFLHISTTIFFESSPHHTFQWNKLLVSFFAAGLAIASEYFI
jgi:zinc transporter ZupT